LFEFPEFAFPLASPDPSADLAPLESSPPAVLVGDAPPLQPEARAVRLAKFEREQLIVDYLNRGVSVAEIATRLNVGEKRMRAVIREILGRRQPHPPEEFVAIQVSRLNEALLVAYSAMSVTNLKAVDQVVRIVRELDRYHGFAAAGRRPAPRLDAPAAAAMTFGAALVCRAEFPPLEVRDREEHSDEAIQGSDGFLEAPASDDGESPPSPGSLPRGRAARPENLPQHPEKIESAPGAANPPDQGDAATEERIERIGACGPQRGGAARDQGSSSPSPSLPHDDRPGGRAPGILAATL
jgi:hypothetical protein